MLQEGPGTQPAMQLRVARHTERLQEVVRFYRDGIGLTQIGGFRGHDGYDGVFLAVPGTGAHLELTAGGGQGAAAPHPESLLVFYLGDEATVQAVAARLSVAPVPPANPYWAEHGLTFQDPDGFRVVLVPEGWEPSARERSRTPRHRGTRRQRPTKAPWARRQAMSSQTTPRPLVSGHRLGWNTSFNQIGPAGRWRSTAPRWPETVPGEAT